MRIRLTRANCCNRNGHLSIADLIDPMGESVPAMRQRRFFYDSRGANQSVRRCNNCQNVIKAPSDRIIHTPTAAALVAWPVAQ